MIKTEENNILNVDEIDASDEVVAKLKFYGSLQKQLKSKKEKQKCSQ